MDKVHDILLLSDDKALTLNTVVTHKMATKQLKKLLIATAVLTMAVGSSGTLSPVIAQAETTPTTVTKNQKTTAEDTTTYDIGEVTLPLSYAWSKGQWRTALNPMVAGLPETLTKEQLADDAYMDGLTYPSGMSKEVIRNAFNPLMGDLTLKKGETVAEFTAAINGETDMDIATTVDQMAQAAGFVAWTIKSTQLYLEGRYTRADYVADYPQIKAYIDAAGEREGGEWMPKAYETALTDDKTFNTLMYSTSQDGTNQVATQYGLTNRDLDLTKVDARGSEQSTRELLESPADWLVSTDPKTGLKTLNLVIMMPVAFAFDDGETATTPTNPIEPAKPVTPDPEPTPDPDPDKPVTPEKPTLPTTPVTPILPEQPGVTTPNQDDGATTGEAGATVTPAKKGTAVYATKKIGLYSSRNFSTKTRRQWYAKQSRINRPMFVVTDYATSKTGALRYRVKDVNHQSTTYGKKGYITANATYTSPVYYQTKQKKLTVINPAGVNAYQNKNLTKRTQHYRQGQVLKVKKIVRHHLTTRMQLTNGQYVTANKKLVISGQQTMAKRVQTKKAINRYTTVNLKRINHHYRKGQKLAVRGWDYAVSRDFSRKDVLRYHVDGGYITANRTQVKVIK